MKIQLKTRSVSFLADTITPVSAYLRVRDRYANTFLLESSDYHGEEDSYSYISCDPMAEFEVVKGEVRQKLPGQELKTVPDLTPNDGLTSFRKQFEYSPTQSNHIETGLFGYISYDSIRYFEDIELGTLDIDIPEIRYSLFRFVIVFDHFKNRCHLIETYIESPDDSSFYALKDLIFKQSVPSFGFSRTTEVSSPITDDEYQKVVEKGIDYCKKGEVFQVVFSRPFETSFKGDEFQVYRSLRSINPSPYLFYFDYGSFKIFGSSPEAQIVINQDEASIYPIAGTFKRTGDDEADAELARKLLQDEKENSEHIMLVDLARNDLSKYSKEVNVETYKEIQYFSHVIHLVSKVTGKLPPDADIMKIVGSTFPAGTLSGAPKYRALQLIAENEVNNRGYYGGAIGFMDFNSRFIHAITIRTFLSKENKLHFRAGAGIVAKSVPNSEVQEVYNKLAALENAMVDAENNR